MHNVSLHFVSTIPTSLLISTADCATALRSTAGARDLDYVTHNVTWYSTTVLASHGHQVESSTLVVKGTAHAGLKEIRAKATVIALANFDVGRLRKRR